MTDTSFRIDECSWQEVIEYIQKSIPRREWVLYTLWDLCELKCIQMDPKQIISYVRTSHTTANLHHIYLHDKNSASNLKEYLDAELISWINAQ